jgi:hypothetical protein
VIWLAWRQFRTQAAVAIGGLAVVALTLTITEPHLVHLYNSSVVTCRANGDCPAAIAALQTTDLRLQNGLNAVLIVVPALIGIFWGAPLIARELDAGTYRLAWTQSVTRTRWLITKIAVVGLAGMAVAGILSLMATWWFHPLDRANMNQFGTFDQRDIALIGYAAFAFALGVTIGVMIRRPLPAMAITFVAFIAVRLMDAIWVRPHLMTPVDQVLALNPNTMSYISSNGGPAILQPDVPFIQNAWIISTAVVDKGGHSLTAQIVANACPNLATQLGGGPQAGGSSIGPAPAAVQKALHDCVVKVGNTFHQVVTYQPASRYWAFQWYEGAMFFALALLMVGFSLWWVRRRLT